MDPKYPSSGSVGAGAGTGAGTGGSDPRSIPITDPYGNAPQGREDAEFAEHAADIVRQRAEQIGERVADIVRDRPITCVFVALGAGYLVGRLLRA